MAERNSNALVSMACLSLTERKLEQSLLARQVLLNHAQPQLLSNLALTATAGISSTSSLVTVLEG